MRNKKNFRNSLVRHKGRLIHGDEIRQKRLKATCKNLGDDLVMHSSLGYKFIICYSLCSQNIWDQPYMHLVVKVQQRSRRDKTLDIPANIITKYIPKGKVKPGQKAIWPRRFVRMDGENGFFDLLFLGNRVQAIIHSRCDFLLKSFIHYTTII